MPHLSQCDKDIARLNGGSLCGGDGGNGTSFRRHDFIFHFHGFQNAENGAFFHLVSNFDIDT